MQDESKELQKNGYDLTLDKFVSRDELRPLLLKPYTIGDYVYASNGVAAVRFRASYAALDYSENKGHPSIVDIFSAKENFNEKVDFDAIKNWMDGLELRPVYEPCLDCDGEGESYCPCCENTSECRSCDGTGNGKEIGKEKYSEDGYMMNDVLFSLEKIELLFNVASKLGATWIVKEKTKGNFFNVGEMHVILMPLMQPSK